MIILSKISLWLEKWRWHLLMGIFTFVYFTLRDHPLSYDIGRHVDLFLRRPSQITVPIFPAYTSAKIFPYGILCVFAPLSPRQTVVMLWFLGWLAGALLVGSAAVWGEKRLSNFYLAPLFLGTVGTFGSRQSLLFASHPYEIGMMLNCAGLFLALSNFPRLAMLAAFAGSLIHPNVIMMTCVVIVVNLIGRRHQFVWLLVMILGLLDFYLFSSLI